MYFISELENNDFLNNDNKYCAINVYASDLSEMSRVGLIPDTTLEIHVEGGEGYVPHMHICKKTGNNIILRLEITRNMYFREKDDRCNILNSRERKALQKYLSETIPYRNNTNWDYIVDTWNKYNPAHMINPNNVSQPDYTTINEPGE